MAKFPAVVRLSNLDGGDGFQISGATASNLAGWSVASAGDVNGDGFDDLIVGAPFGGSETSYVIFGRESGSFVPDLNVDALGNRGFAIDGGGISVASAGDLNKDGFDDLVIGSTDFDRAFVVFGKPAGFGDLDLGNLGSQGFEVFTSEASTFLGRSVASAGDIDGDGFDDIVVGDPFAGPTDAGASYVVFGRETGFADVDVDALGDRGFRIVGEDAGDQSGLSVASAGDVNGDGFDDLIIGAPSAEPGGVRSGRSYVLFGKETGFDDVDLGALGAAGFTLDGPEDALAGQSVASAGDVNGDGFDDLIIGAPTGEADNTVTNSGLAYVVFGKAEGLADLDLDALGAGGFRIVSPNAFERIGESVSSAGDVNGDGFDDVIVGSNRGGISAAYVIYGKASGFSEIDVSTLDGENGFKILGEADGDFTGFSVSAAGDVNGDGVDDLIVGAPRGAPNGVAGAGGAYVIFGVRDKGPLDLKGTKADDKLKGGEFGDTLSGAGGDDTLIGGKDGDTLVGGKGADTLNGGKGDDAASYAGATRGVTADLGDASKNQGEAKGDKFRQVENLIGSSNDDSLRGDAGDNVVDGGAGADTLDGGKGADTLKGGKGDDTYFLDGLLDSVVDTGGVDEIQSDKTLSLRNQLTIENGTLTGDGRADLDGNGLDNKLTGNSVANEILGRMGDDTIDGGGGGDFLVGGFGQDQLIGGAGNDVFVSVVAGESLTDSRDIVRDFKRGEDRISTLLFDADVNLDGFQQFDFIGRDSFTKNAGELRFRRTGDGVVVEGDVDGDGKADFAIDVRDVNTLNRDDFIGLPRADALDALF